MATRGSQLLSCIKSSCEPDAGQLVMLLGVYLLCSPPLNGLFGKCDKDCARPLLPLSLFSHSVASDSLRPHRLQHTRLPCSSLTPRFRSNSCPLNQWCYLSISSSAAPIFFCLQSFPASGYFPVSQLFASGGQSIGVHLQHQSFQWIFRVDFL